MHITSNKLARFSVVIFIASLLLSACETTNYRPSCSTPADFTETITKRYGHKNVMAYLLKAEQFIVKKDIDAALSAINDGLALPNINDYGRFSLYRTQGHVYFSATKDVEGVAAFRKALSIGAANSGEANFMAASIENMTNERKNMGDVDAQPIVRVAPPIPPRMYESGHCYVQFDVSAQGVVENIRATYCTNPILKEPTVKSVKHWKYAPKMVAGKATNRTGVNSKITYVLIDECGNPIPEPLQASNTANG